MASAQYGLDTNEGDVAATLRTLGRVSSPAIPRSAAGWVQ